MSFRPCILIPIYNHKDTIAACVAQLAAYQLSIFIIDDGSDQATQDVLTSVANSYPLVKLYRLPENGGKGAAVMHGMQLAEQQGYSHALQIDADGQHAIEDVPKFLAASALEPEAVICGKPIYDASVPKGRLYGRYITHFWVWVETLSFAIADSMCGFRLYPLASSCAVIRRRHIPKRMDFDIAIVVHLAWQGLTFRNIPTRVIYPAGGISHFNMLRDNLNISKTHTQLFFGMLKRLPSLLWRKLKPARRATSSQPLSQAASSLHWSAQAERGNRSGLGFIESCYRLLGKPVAQLLLYPVVGYFFLFHGKARRASSDYLQRLHTFQQQKPAQKPGWLDSYKHMHAFASASLDKLGAWRGEAFDLEFPAQAQMEALLASGKGAMLIGAHLGNLEMMRAIASLQGKTTVNAVVYTEHAQRFNHMLARNNPDFHINLLQISSFGPDTAIMLKQKIDQGELLVIVGDRTPPADNGRISMVPFLGQPAAFAQGPLILASLLDCPVYLFFCLQHQQGYQIHFEPFAEKVTLPRQRRQQALEDYLRQYVQRLQHYCQLAPYQWFNFYDFWATERSSRKSDTSRNSLKA